MVWCNNCAKNVVGVRPDDCQLWCPICGRILEEFYFSSEPSFVKNVAGQSQLSGNYVRTIQSDRSISRERAFENASEEMRTMRSFLSMGESEEIINVAMAFYRIAVERNFTRGRHGRHVQAACLYIACREKEKPYLLIDFSNYLQISVYVLGAVFLQLCKVLSLEEHPIVQKLVDPSLFIHKFTECLFGKKLDDKTRRKITETSLHIVASMKRDWMQTGRKPSGLCGAAIYISALSQGLKCTKSDIVRIVHICDATLTKRLVEFENTESGSLTIEEFIEKAKELQQYSLTKEPNIGLKVSGAKEVLCEHTEHFAHGLCKVCYDKFVEISGGLEGGADPPAFQRAERERLAQASAKQNANDSSLNDPCQTLNSSKHTNIDKESSGQCVTKSKEFHSTAPESISGASDRTSIDESDNHKSHGVDGMSTEPCEEFDSLSDIDDIEVDGYLHNEEEKHYKKIIWEEMNREYLEEQAAKEAAAAAAKEAFQANFENRPDLQAAQELAAATAAAVAKSRKERQQKRAAEAKNSGPAQTAAEATRQMLTKKRLSSKINYDVLDALFDDSVAPGNTKRKQSLSHSDNDEEMLNYNKKKLESKEKFKNGELETENEYEDEGDAGAAYGNDFDYGIQDEAYDYDDSYGNEEY